ncbi:MAG: 1,4-dihydroxy-2-naphthoate octaprenyltransferase [Thermoplasmata archaeon]
MGSRAEIWAKEIRAPFLSASILPILLGTAIAYARYGIFYWEYFLLALLGGIFLHIGANVVNDYFDYKSGTDNVNVEYTRPFTGGSRMIQKGLMSPREVLVEAMLFFTLGGVIGLYLAWVRGIVVIILGIIGIFSGFFYTAPPVDLAKRGIGELFIGLNFGILLTLGAYYVQVQNLAWEPALASLPLAILIASVLFINEFPDYKADRIAGKRHLVVRLGRKRAAKGHALLMASVYLCVVLFVSLGWIVPFALISLLTLPLAITSIRFSRDFYDDSFRIIPSNASTVQCHLFTGLLLFLAYFISAFVEISGIAFLMTVLLFGAFMFVISNRLESAKEGPPPSEVSS